MERGVIVDVETTGLDAEKDEVIEIGLLEFLYDKSFDEEPQISGVYGGLEDPGEEISPEITAITGITNETVRGQTIRWNIVREYLEDASVVVAHNAKFDAGFLAQRIELANLDLHWACSASHIDWGAKGRKTRALNYLAADYGFVNPFAHRAVFDCATTFRICAPFLKELVERSYLRSYVINALGSPFESKDVLRKRGYRWNPEARYWHRTILEDKLEAEREFLSKEVYQGPPRHEEIEQGAR